MMKSELIRAVRSELGIRLPEARVLVDAIFGEIMASLMRGEKVELRGIGTFRSKSLPSRWGRDFRAKRAVRLPPTMRVSYKISRRLRARLNAPASNPS